MFYTYDLFEPFLRVCKGKQSLERSIRTRRAERECSEDKNDDQQLTSEKGR